jgi:hypothetical protein
MTDRQLRIRIREFAQTVVIHKDGAVHAFGTIPNTSQRGWYFVGWKNELKREYAHEVA